MLQHMDTSLGSPTAWQSRYLEVEDVDDTRAPECVELVMTYTRAVTGRHVCVRACVCVCICV